MKTDEIYDTINPQDFSTKMDEIIAAHQATIDAANASASPAPSDDGSADDAAASPSPSPAA